MGQPLIRKFHFRGILNEVNISRDIKIHYPNVKNKSDIKTFGVKATLCTSVDISEKIVYAITREIFANLDDFKKIHPAYSGLTKENMIEALSAPIHPGAIKYYKEVGIVVPSSGHL